MMLNCDSRDRFVDQYLTFMKESFSCTYEYMCQKFYLKILRFQVSHFDFDIIYVTSASDQVTRHQL